MSMDLLIKLCTFWFTSDFFAIGLFAFAGVGIRSVIHYSLQGCIEANTTSDYGPFIQNFYSQTYLASNLLGCFIMSFCIANTAKISTISVPLYKGLTTGLCGSITTLSSWMNGSVNMFFDKYWYKIIIMIVLEFWLTWSAFTMGYAFAKIVDNMVSKYTRYMAKHNEDQQSTDGGNPNNANNGIELTPQHPVILNDDEDVRLSSKELHELSSTRADQLDALEAMDNVNETSAGLLACGGAMRRGEEKLYIDGGAHQPEGDMQSNGNLYAAVAKEGMAMQVAAASRPPGTASEGTTHSRMCALCRKIQQNEYYIWATLLITVATVLWIILILEPQFAYFDDIKVRNIYRSVALAPLGAWTRWGLTRFPEIKALWPNMHPQTFIANITAVTFMCLLTVFGTTSWVPAINAGFNGALSTVSTFVAELHTLYLEKGPLVSLRYFLATIVLSIAIIQIVRGGNAGDS